MLSLTEEEIQRSEKARAEAETARRAAEEKLAAEAEALGFAGVLSGPLVRSSYRAGRLHAQARARHSASR